MDFFNLCDYCSLVLFGVVIVQDIVTGFTGPAHNFLVLVSYLGAMSLFNVFKPCRTNIDLIIQCLKYITTFTMVLVYILLTFSLFYSFKNGEDREFEDVNDTSLWYEMKKVLPLMLGGASWEDGSPHNFDLIEDVGQIISTYLLTILMLNLLVGILSEKLAEIVAMQTISSYRLLLDICIDHETFSRFIDTITYIKSGEGEREHLVYA
jgi:hypothetical protein